MLLFGELVFATCLGTVLSDWLKRSGDVEPDGRVAAKTSVGATHLRNKGNTPMSGPYDLIGDDDELAGAIGADLLAGIFGDDGDALQALISGDGSSEIIGAARRGGSAAAKKAAVLKALAMRNGGAVVNRGLDKKRRYPLGFVPTTITAGTAALVPSAPQNLFRPERLVIPSDIAFDFGVRDVKVGNQSQLVQSVEVPAAVFTEVSIDTNVTFDTAEVGNQISVDVRNKSGVDIEFTAALIGTIAKQ